MDVVAWIAAGVGTTLAVVALAWVAFIRQRPPSVPALPTEWALSARPVFSNDERRVYKLLREALPHHIVLSKLPLVRFSQPSDPEEMRFWYDLLGAIHVTFAICSANGRVLAAIDLDTDRGNSRRLVQIKQSVLSACRVRYLRCPVDHMPTVGEIQLLVPSAAAPARGPQPAPAPTANLHQARDTLSSTVATRRAERTALWQDSTVFQDSFFAPDARMDNFGSTEFGSPSHATPASRNPPGAPARFAPHRETHGAPLITEDDEPGGGVVVDQPRYSGASSA